MYKLFGDEVYLPHYYNSVRYLLQSQTPCDTIRRLMNLKGIFDHGTSLCLRLHCIPARLLLMGL